MNTPKGCVGEKESELETNDGLNLSRKQTGNNFSILSGQVTKFWLSFCVANKGDFVAIFIRSVCWRLFSPFLLASMQSIPASAVRWMAFFFLTFPQFLHPVFPPPYSSKMCRSTFWIYGALFCTATFFYILATKGYLLSFFNSYSSRLCYPRYKSYFPHVSL